MWGNSKEHFENKKHNTENKSTLKEKDDKNNHKSVSDDIMAELNEIKSNKGEAASEVSNSQDKDLKHDEKIKGYDEKQEDKDTRKSVADDIMAELERIKSCVKEENESAKNKSRSVSKYVKAEKGEKKNKEDEKDKKSYKGCIGEIFFYLVLIAVVFGIFTLKGNGAPNSIAGFSAFTVLSSSMESEIPKGSLVITKHIDPNELKVGDDITYMNRPTTTITHRIVDIIEEYDEFGDRAFKTKGIMNDSPDKLPVPAANVVGKVIFHNYELGQIVEFVSQYWYIIIIFFVLFFGFYALIKKLFLKPEKSKE